MIVKEPYYFEDGRVGTLTKSDKVFKTEEVAELNEDGTPKVNANGEEIKTTKTTYYKIRKKGTNEVYDEAIDVLYFEYEEVTEAEMVAQYDSNK